MYKKITLKNGLRVLLLPRAETEAVTVLLGVGVGSRDEEDRIAGISHFKEHMNFKGSAKRPTAKEVSEFIEDRGGIVNAYTGKQHTCYYVKIASEHLGAALDYISDNVQNPINSPEEFERERGVIIEDLKMHKDRPMEEVAEIFEETIFSDRALARRIGGDPESVAKITHDDLLNFEKKYYHTANYVLGVVGNYSEMGEERLLALIEQSFKESSAPKISRSISDGVESAAVVCDKRSIEQTNLIVGFNAPGYRDKRRYALKLLARILGGSMSSRMFSEIRESKGLAYAIDTSYGGYDEIGSIETYAGIANENLKQVIEAIIEEYKKIKHEPVSDQELARAKEITKGIIKISFEDSEELADEFVTSELDEGRVLTPEEIIDHYMNVTVADVQEVAQSYLDFSKMVVSVVGPGADKAEIESWIKNLQY